MAQSSRSVSAVDSSDDEFLYAQLSSLSPGEPDKTGSCRISMKKFQDLCSGLHIPVSGFNRINAQRQFLKSILGTLLNSELQLASDQNYQGEVLSTSMSYPDKLPVLEVVLLDAQKREDPDALIPLNSYRFNLNDKWEIVSVSVRQQAYSDGDVDIIDTKDKKIPKLRKVVAELSTDETYAGPDFNEDYIENLLEDIQFIKLDDHINAAFQYFNFDRDKLRQTLSAVESDLKKLNEKAKDQNVPKELTDEIAMLDTLLRSQQRLCHDFAKDMGNAQAAFQEERAYNKAIIIPLHNILNEMQEVLYKQVSKDLTTIYEEKSEITNPHELLGYVSMASIALEELIDASKKSYQEFRNKVEKKLSYLRTEYPEKFDKISENMTKATLADIQKRIEKQPESTVRNNHLNDLVQLQEELQELEESNKANLEQQQAKLSWVPKIKLNLNNVQERDYANELKNASSNLQQFFQFYSQVDTLLSQSRSHVSDNTINLILSTCNFVLHNPNVADATKTQLIASLNNELLEGCIVRDKKTGDFIFLSDKRRQDVEETYRDNLPNIDVVLHGLEHVRSKIVSTTAQLDFALNPNPDHPEDATFAALANDFKQSASLSNMVKQYNTERQQLRTTSRSIASRIADIKKSPELRGRLSPMLLTLEHDLTEVSLMQRQDNPEKNIADLAAYKMLEERYKPDTEKLQAVVNKFDAIIGSIQQQLLKLQETSTSKKLNFDYTFRHLSLASQIPNMNDKIAIINDLIQHDYEIFSDDTISFRLRDWLKKSLQQNPIPGLLVDANSKKLIYHPDKQLVIASQNIQRMQKINGKIAHDLKAGSESQKPLTTSWEAKQASVDNAIATATNELAQITELRQTFATSIEKLSQQKIQFELNFIRDLALYQETLTEVESNEAHQKIFADVKTMEAMIKEMRGLQQSFDGETPMPLIHQTADKIKELHEKATALLNGGTQYQAALFKPDVLQVQNEKMALRKWLFLQIRTLVLDGLSNYWNGKGTDRLQLDDQQYQVPRPIKEMTEKILLLDKKKSAKSLPITEQDIQWLLDISFKQSQTPEPIQKIYAMFQSIRNSNLQDSKILEAINEDLSSTIEVALQIPASKASLNKLFQIIQHVILGELPFWDTQHGKNKFQLNGEKYEHLPHRVMQMAESFNQISADKSPDGKIAVLLGKDAGKKGFFAEKPSLDILKKRTASTNALYRAMTLLHSADISKEANVKMLITQFDNLQNTVNDAKKSIAPDRPHLSANKNK